MEFLQGGQTAFLRKEAYGFMKKNVVIIGLGLIGGSLAKAFQKYSECSVSGIDLSLIHI